MSNTAKIILGVVVAVVVIGGIWWWVAASQTAQAPAYPAAQNPTAQTQNATSTTANTSTPTQANGVSATDSSNAALQADLSNVDTQMNGFSSDNASVSQGMNDQPVQQSQF